MRFHSRQSHYAHVIITPTIWLLRIYLPLKDKCVRCLCTQFSSVIFEEYLTHSKKNETKLLSSGLMCPENKKVAFSKADPLNAIYTRVSCLLTYNNIEMIFAQYTVYDITGI